MFFQALATWVVLGIGVAGYFGFKAIKKSVTGGGEFENFDKSLRAGTEEGGLDVKNFGTGAGFVSEECDLVLVEGNYLLLDAPFWRDLWKYLVRGF